MPSDNRYQNRPGPGAARQRYTLELSAAHSDRLGPSFSLNYFLFSRNEQGIRWARCREDRYFCSDKRSGRIRTKYVLRVTDDKT